jgi:hypothetical protein
MNTHPGITLNAIFAKAATTVDGGWNVTLSVDASQANEIMQLTALRDSVLQCAFIPIDELETMEDLT